MMTKISFSVKLASFHAYCFWSSIEWLWLFLRVRRSLGRGRCPATCSLVAVETYPWSAGPGAGWACECRVSHRLAHGVLSSLPFLCSCHFSSLLEVVCCGLDRSSPLLSVLCQCFPLTVVYASLCQLPLQLVLDTLAGGTTVALALT